jgi:hypothetical protein
MFDFEEGVDLDDLLLLLLEFLVEGDRLVARALVALDPGLRLGHLPAQFHQRVLLVREHQQQADRHHSGDTVQEKRRADGLGVRQPLEIAEVRMPCRHEGGGCLFRLSFQQRRHGSEPSG